MVPLGWGCCGHCRFDSPFSPVHFAHRFTLRLERRALRFHLVRGVVDNIVMFPLTTSRLVSIDKVTPPDGCRVLRRSRCLALCVSSLSLRLRASVTSERAGSQASEFVGHSYLSPPFPPRLHALRFASIFVLRTSRSSY